MIKIRQYETSASLIYPSREKLSFTQISKLNFIQNKILERRMNT